MISKRLQGLAWIWTFVFASTCILIPLLSVLSRGFSHLSEIDSHLVQVSWVTFKQAFLSTIISASVGLPLGIGIGGVSSKRVRSAIQAALNIPNGVPSVVAATSWVILLGRSGWFSALGWSYSLNAVILAHVFFNIPFVALLVSHVTQDISQNQKEALRTLGAGWFSEFRFLTWPQIRGAWVTATSQVFSFCSMSFVLVLILGGGPPVQTLETELYGKLRYSSIDIGGAAICGFLELLITVIPWIAVYYFQLRKKSHFETQACRRSYLAKTNVQFSGALLGITALVLVFPYFGVLNSSVFSVLQNPEIYPALLKSIELAVLCAVFSVLTAVFSILVLQKVRSSLGQVIYFLLTLPSGVSILVFSLGFWFSYYRWIDPFEGSFFAILFLQAVLFFPLAFRILYPRSFGIQKNQLQAAATLGAGPLKAFWYVEWPRWRSAVFSAFAAVVGGSLGEVGAVSFFYNEKLVTLPLLVSQWMRQYHFEAAQGLAGFLLLLSVFCTIGFLNAYEY